MSKLKPPAAPGTAPAAPAAPKPPAAAKKAPAVPKEAKAPKPPKAAAEPKPPKAPKPVKEAKPKAVKVEKNGIVRPKDGTACGTIWLAADTTSAKKKAPADFTEVSKALEGKGINDATMRTQFQRWRVYNGLKGKTAAAA